jgi:hypothetical protein
MVSARGQGTEIVVAVGDKAGPHSIVEPAASREEKASAA